MRGSIQFRECKKERERVRKRERARKRDEAEKVVKGPLYNPPSCELDLFYCLQSAQTVYLL